jgi:protein subunit release factor B
VKCQTERSQAINRFLARRILVEKIEELKLGKESSRQRKIEKLRRQKLKRAKRAKAKLCQGDTENAKEQASDEPSPSQKNE